MTKTTRLSLLATGAVLLLILALGVTGVFAQSDGDDTTPDDETTTPESQPDSQSDDQSEQPESFGHHGMPGHFGLPEGLSSKDELLADALGIDIETLDAARETARVAAIEQALDEELITEEQADMLLNGTYGFGFHRGHDFHGFAGPIDQDALLAEALDISVEELEAAEQQAHEAALAEMVDAGYMTEEEAELMTAREALKETIDRKALLAQVLNLSEAELEEALTNRESMAALIEGSGLTVDEFNAAMQTAYEAAVQQAVEDGVITAEQYQALQDAGLDSLGLLGGHGHGGGHGRGGHGPHGGFGASGSFEGFGQPSSTTSPTAMSI